MKFTGGCHCGSIKFHGEVDAEKVAICHCTDCQKLSGTAFRTIAFVPESDISFDQGEIKDYIKIAESGNERAQGFCPNCGSAIYATSVGDSPKMYAMRVGSIDQRDELVPQKQIWCQSAQSWLPEFDTVKVTKQS